MAIRHIQTVVPNAAEGLVARVYPQIKKEFGALVEPFTLHSPLRNCWQVPGVPVGTQSAVGGGGYKRVGREIKGYWEARFVDRTGAISS